MKYSITINGYLDVETTTKDLAVFLARQLKALHPNDEVKVYRKAECIMEVR